MYPVERQTANDRAQGFLSQHRFKLASSAPEDRATAELSLIASQVWRQLCDDLVADRARILASGYGGSAPPFTIGGEAVLPQAIGKPIPELNLSRYPKMIVDRWSKFCDDFVMSGPKTIDMSSLAMADLVRPDSVSPAPEPQLLEVELREYVSKADCRAIILDMCNQLRVDIPPELDGNQPDSAADEPADAVPSGLVRATPEDVEAARLRPKADYSHRLVKAEPRTPEPGSATDAARSTRAKGNALAR